MILIHYVTSLCLLLNAKTRDRKLQLALAITKNSKVRNEQICIDYNNLDFCLTRLGNKEAEKSLQITIVEAKKLATYPGQQQLKTI